MRVQQCCVNAMFVCPINEAKMGRPTGCGCCNQTLIPMAGLSCPPLCFSTCDAPNDDMFPTGSDLCCASSCYCCISGWDCKFPQCCAARAKATANCAPFMPDEPFAFEASVQQLFYVARSAYPLNPTIPSSIGCCGIVCWTNPKHPGGLIKAKTDEDPVVPSGAITVQQP